ncbi:MAG TPA: TerC family protein [Streptosporangiaceae bacterium]|nr:TerC family protein [Streptosporangiaceae bacterium]
MPTWAWAVTLPTLALVVVADLAFSRREGGEPGLRTSALWTLGVLALGTGFGLLLGFSSAPTTAGQFFAGWLTEFSLSLDNLFVFALLIGLSAVPGRLRGRVLLAGILISLLLRGVFIAGGAAALSHYHWVLYMFGGFLLLTSLRFGMSSGAVTAPRIRPNPASGSVLGLIVVIGVTDVIFAMDSVPAVFGLTRDPALVFATNAFALLGLRHMYFLIGGLLGRLAHLQAGLTVVLAFIGVKLIAEGLTASGVREVGRVPVPQIGPGLSLAVIASVLVTATITSLATSRRRKRVSPRPAAESDERPPHRGLPAESPRWPAA